MKLSWSEMNPKPSALAFAGLSQVQELDAVQHGDQPDAPPKAATL
ncbi:MAG: hypothetical protein M5U22_16910 [Thermoleophilia bacterium]|nr:hypothetical protein [Thermoleophilia bacterium]